MLVAYRPDLFDEEHPETAEWYDWVKKNFGKDRDHYKGVTFAFQFGAFPPKIAKMLKISLDEAKVLHKAYLDTYPGVARWNQKTVKFAEEHGYVELGLGLNLQTPTLTKEAKARVRYLRIKFNEEAAEQQKCRKRGEPAKEFTVSEKDLKTAEAILLASERSAANATIQFWDLLTLQGLHKIQERIEEAGYDNDIIGHATVYDSMYFEIRNDIQIIEWFNNNLIECMIEDFMEDQPIKLVANLDIGTSWADLQELPNNCDTSVIQKTLSKLMV